MKNQHSCIIRYYCQGSGSCSKAKATSLSSCRYQEEDYQCINKELQKLALKDELLK
jgi:hypothetical protein